MVAYHGKMSLIKVAKPNTTVILTSMIHMLSWEQWTKNILAKFRNDCAVLFFMYCDDFLYCAIWYFDSSLSFESNTSYMKPWHYYHFFTVFLINWKTCIMPWSILMFHALSQYPYVRLAFGVRLVYKYANYILKASGYKIAGRRLEPP